MSQGIAIELHFFLISILWGALVLLAYDQLRVLRRIIRHKDILITIQDLLFWVIASVFIFAMIYENNSGIIRGFSVMGMVIGMVLYHYILSDIIVTILSRGILLLLRPFLITLKYLRKCLKFIVSKIKKLLNKSYMQLKKLIKSVKISVAKKKQKKIEKAKASKSKISKKESKSSGSNKRQVKTSKKNQRKNKESKKRQKKENKQKAYTEM